MKSITDEVVWVLCILNLYTSNGYRFARTWALSKSVWPKAVDIWSRLEKQDHRHLSISLSWAARIKTGSSPRQRQYIQMRGGSLTRYDPPTARGQDGDGFTEELIKIAAPVVLESLQSGLRTASSGKSLGVVGDVIGQTSKRGVKRKAGR